GEELLGTIAAHPLRGLGYDYDVPVLNGDFVTMDAGTGFVHIAPGHGAVALTSLGKGLAGAGRRDRLIAQIVDGIFQDEAEAVFGFAQDDVLPHLRCCRGWNPAVKVDDLMGAALGHIDLHRAKAGDPAHHGIDHGLHEGTGERGIDRIAAGS
ncbi:MAG: class I tRNA ligase family protein, partial [Rhodospirillaceae bacterium]|nr:class I tRNA ligase family protein [Rhodospirillaceae bacterium]